MSWFLLKDQPKRGLRKGIWLRVRNLPEKISKEINKNLPFGSQIDWVSIQELQHDGKVLLEVWSTTFLERMRSNRSLGGKNY